MELLNKSQLATELGRARGYISAMVASGYQCQYGTRTTLSHALRWLAANPDFRTTRFFHPEVRRGTTPSRQRRVVDKSCAPLNSNDR